MTEDTEPERSGRRTRGLIRRFLPYYKPHVGTLAFDLLCTALTCVCELVLPVIVRRITEAAQNDIASLTTKMILTAGGVYLGLRIMDAFARYYMASVGHIMGTRIETDLRRDLFGHLMKLSFSYYDDTKVGVLMSRLTNDLFDVTEFAHHCPEEFSVAAIKTIVSFAILMTINVPLTLILFALLPPTGFVLVKLNHKMRAGFKESRKTTGELNARAQDSLTGIRVVKSFAGEPTEESKFRTGNEDFLDVKSRIYRIMGTYSAVQRFSEGLMYIVIVVVGAFFIRSSKIDAGDLIAYLLYVTALINSISRIVEFAEQFQRGVTGIERFFEIMDIDPDITDAKDAVELKVVHGSIEYRDVTFSYNGEEGNVLSHIDISVPAGRNIAVVGPSGSGKTTLCCLLPRFYDIDCGEITIDGIDIKKIKLRSLRSAIGVVQQEVYMFYGSVRENILYGRPDATEDDVIRAAKMAGAYDFIMALPDGFDSYVGENGVKLSGGQKQRIAIARVFLKDPPIVILDEATSSLDNDSERLVQESLEKLSKGRTTITIAHRLSTIRGADEILMLTKDGIVERGTHQQLMAKGGKYAELYGGE